MDKSKQLQNLDKAKQLILSYSAMLIMGFLLYKVYEKQTTLKYIGVSIVFTLYVINYYITPFLIDTISSDINNPFPKCSTISEYSNELTSELNQNKDLLESSVNELSLIHI